MIKIEDGKVQLRDGKMHYQKAGSGSPLVLLPSNFSSVWCWSRVIEPLARNHTVYAVDTMGQGDSDKPTRDFTMEDYAASVVEFMKVKKIDKATVMGNSIGAIIAIQMAAAHAAQVDKLVLVGCPFRKTPEERKEALDGFRKHYDAAFAPLPYSMTDMKNIFAHPDKDMLAKFNDDRMKAGVWAWKISESNYDYDVAAALKKVKAPTLLILGVQDSRVSTGEDMQKQINNAKLIIIPDASHITQMDQPAVFTAAVEQFLA